MLRKGHQGGIAARVGGWSARHKKSVLVGWLVFVVLAVVLGSAVGTKKLTQADSFVGQSGKAEKTLEQHFPTPAHEEALIYSSTMKANDPAFKAAIANIRDRVAKIPVVDNVRAANDADGTGLVSKDGHSALVQFDIKGDKQTAGDRIAPVEAAIHAAQKQYPQLRIEEFGDASVGTQIDKSIQQRPEAGRDAVSAGDVDHPRSSPSAPWSPPACPCCWRSRRVIATDRPGRRSPATSSRSTRTPRS